MRPNGLLQRKKIFMTNCSVTLNDWSRNVWIHRHYVNSISMSIYPSSSSRVHHSTRHIITSLRLSRTDLYAFHYSDHGIRQDVESRFLGLRKNIHSLAFLGRNASRGFLSDLRVSPVPDVNCASCYLRSREL